MHSFLKKLKFFPVLVVVWMSMPFMVAAQTNSMTDNGMIQDGQRPLPVVSNNIKSLVRGTQIALADKKIEPVSQEIEIQEETILAEYNTNVDASQIQEAWLGWINYERSTRGISPLELDLTLNTTSTERSTHLADIRKFTRMHQRPQQACKNYRCYDVNPWFAERGVSQGAESVIYGGYSCKAEDCTQDLIETTRWRIGWPSGFLGFLLGEKSYNGVHYRMMMNPSYTKVGVGFAKTNHPWFGSAYIGVLHYSQ